jgi:DNA (cytosine-5)-methyltransferase 1
VNVGSLFSGIGGLDLGLHRAGMRHVFFCESDPYRRDVLRARFPGVPVYEDVACVAVADAGGGSGAGGIGSSESEGAHWEGRWRPSSADLLCGGFPCQDLSIAGRRAGLAGERSSLFHEFARIADALRPRWLLVENVPGLLSSNGGRDFGVVLGTLADLGYGVGWRILDSRFFGVPQRRRRVFIVGALADGDPRAAAERCGEILAVGQGCARHLKAGGEAGQELASALTGGAGGRGWSGDNGAGQGDTLVASLSGLGSGGPDDNDDQGGRLIADTVRSHPRPGSNSDGLMIAAGLTGRYGKGADSDATDAIVAVHMLQDPINDENITPAWGKGTKSGSASIAVSSEAGVRRLTPTECERLQALPDGWTDLGGTPDSRRYAALGDAVTASVAEWIGHQLMQHLEVVA